MHLADGVLSPSVLAVTAVAAVAAVTIGLRRLGEAQLPAAALMGAAFLIASAIYVPVGVGSVHLILNGLAGLMLGWAVFPVLFVSLLLQAVLFSFGGLTSLGANLLILGVPGLLAHLIFHRALVRRLARPGGLSAGGAITVGAASGLLGTGGAILLASLALQASGGSDFAHLVILFATAHVPVLLLDPLISGLTLSTLVRLVPDALA